MTSEGKSARDLIANVQAALFESLIEQNAPDNISGYAIMETIVPVLERESRLSIAAALEMAARLIEDLLESREWTNAEQQAMECASKIRKLTPESVAHARAEHDKEIQERTLIYALDWLSEKGKSRMDYAIAYQKLGEYVCDLPPIPTLVEHDRAVRENFIQLLRGHYYDGELGMCCCQATHIGVGTMTVDQWTEHIRALASTPEAQRDA